MFISMQIVFGFVVGGIGLLRIADSPGPGICALLLAGGVILRGIDQLWRADDHSIDE